MISHDDHYYDVADRVVKLDYGRLELDDSLDRYLESVAPAVAGLGALGERTRAG